MIFFQNIPEELRTIPHWTIHKDKIPLKLNGEIASINRSEDWSSWKDLMEFLQDNLDQSKIKFDGIGFVFKPELGFVFIDFDHVIDDQGNVNHEVEQIIEKINSYTEISQSGHGLHTYVRSHIPEYAKGHAKKLQREYGGLEVYEEKFSVITGNVYKQYNKIREIEHYELFDILGIQITEKLKEEEKGNINEISKDQIDQLYSILDKHLKEGNRNAFQLTLSVLMKNAGLSKEFVDQFYKDYIKSRGIQGGITEAEVIKSITKLNDYIFKRDYQGIAPKGFLPISVKDLKNIIWKGIKNNENEEEPIPENAVLKQTSAFDVNEVHYEQIRRGFAYLENGEPRFIRFYKTGEFVQNPNRGKKKKKNDQTEKEFSEIVFIPIDNDQVKTGQIILPEKPEKCNSIMEIVNEIEEKTKKWLYISPEEYHVFRVQIRLAIASWFLFVYDNIQIQERIGGLLSIMGTSGGGKKRWLTLLRQIAYRPIYLLNTDKIPSVFRMADPWGTPTLLIDEADQKETGSEAEWVQFINARYDGTPIPRYNASTERIDTFRSFGLTGITLRRMPKDEGIVSRMIKINATISPISLPEVAGDDIFKEFESVRNRLLYLRLKYYGKLKFVGFSGLPPEHSWRGKEALTLFRILEQIDPEISGDIEEVSKKLTESEVKNLSQSWDGLIINEIYNFINDALENNEGGFEKRGNGFYFYKKWIDREGIEKESYLNLKYIADRLAISSSEVQRSLTQFKISVYERFRPEGNNKPQRGILKFSYPEDTDRVFSKYVVNYGHELLKLKDYQKTLDGVFENNKKEGNNETPPDNFKYFRIEQYFEPQKIEAWGVKVKDFFNYNGVSYYAIDDRYEIKGSGAFEYSNFVLRAQKISKNEFLKEKNEYINGGGS